MRKTLSLFSYILNSPISPQFKISIKALYLEVRSSSNFRRLFCFVDHHWGQEVACSISTKHDGNTLFGVLTDHFHPPHAFFDENLKIGIILEQLHLSRT